MDELISVIIPLYNGENRIRECLNSLINQTYKRIEIIVINDGSTDSSENIVKEMQEEDQRIKIYNKENGGQSSARNLGISKSKGNYICFIDCDDYVDLNMIFDMFKFSKQHDLDLVISGMIFDYIDEKYYQENNFNYIKYTSDKTELKNIIYDSCVNGLIYSPCNKLYKTSLIKDQDLKFLEGTEPIEDVVFNCEYIKLLNSVGVLDKAYYHYVKRNVESTVSKFHNNLEKMSKSRNDKLKELFDKYNMNDEKYRIWLAQEYIGGKANCISNIYNKNSNYTAKMKTTYLKEIIFSDKKLKKAIRLVDNDLDYFDKKILVFLFKFKSAFFMRKSYDVLFFCRNKFQKIYCLLRKKVKKEKEENLHATEYNSSNV